MKKCPYCQEEIQDEAVKCRFCLSSLAPKSDARGAEVVRISQPERVIYSIDRKQIRWAKFLALLVIILLVAGIFLYLYGFNFRQSGPRPDQVVYVVDQGLLRFIKFSAAAFAIFVTVGVFLYGFNLKETGKEIRDVSEKVREQHRDAKATGDEIHRLKEDLIEHLSESRELVKEMQASRDSTRMDLEKLAEEVKENRQKLELLIEEGETAVAEFKSRAAIVQEKKEKVSPKPSPEAKTRAFTVPELAKIYEFPSEFDGSGQCIGLIELGGGYRVSDLKAYFAKLGVKMPRVTLVSVDGATNKPSSGSGADFQVTMDIEVAGAVASGAHIVVYMASNTNESFLNAINEAITDQTNKPSVLSISWGSPESIWGNNAMAEFDNAFQRAAALGITVVCAAGDNGVTDGVQDGKPHVDFPASSPWVLACGGTKLTHSERRGPSEVVWNDGDSGTGGGVSDAFVRPPWQAGVDIPAGPNGNQGRGVPDVAANASPQTGYVIYARGKSLVLGGTSAATPLWAGLIAVLNQGLGRNVGFFNPVLYGPNIGPAGVLRGITEGNNSMHKVKGYEAGPGWDACTGWGTPNGIKLLNALRKTLK